jgi:hypothetical protein
MISCRDHDRLQIRSYVTEIFNVKRYIQNTRLFSGFPENITNLESRDNITNVPEISRAADTY